MDRKRLASAFTLIELVVVITIVGLISAMAIPRWSLATERYRADAAAQRIAADVQLARARARLTSASVQMEFQPGALRYRLANVPNPDRPAETYSVVLSEEPYRCAQMQVTLNDGGQTLTFDAGGAPSTAGTVQISSRNQTRLVTIQAGSGKTAITTPAGGT